MPSTATGYKHHPHYLNHTGHTFKFEPFTGDERDPRRAMDLEDGRLEGLDAETVLLAHMEQQSAWEHWEAARRDRALRAHLRRMPPVWDTYQDTRRDMDRALDRLVSGEIALHAAVTRLEDAHTEALKAAQAFDASAERINLIWGGPDEENGSSGEVRLLLAPLGEIADRVCVDISGWPLEEDLEGDAPNNSAAVRQVRAVIFEHQKHVDRARSV